ncbi:hypothetical protein DPMN_056067 [Dreissena polymorpha]|uniref:Uncharacterized protein n=1 Tax=Dreissena polymorpha TaxID=45954 RepID=A0A9D4CTM7_DREPO|nr:hypothetical protein DPMN_056067 [Dreissena polymorpha]
MASTCRKHKDRKIITTDKIVMIDEPAYSRNDPRRSRDLDTARTSRGIVLFPSYATCSEILIKLETATQKKKDELANLKEKPTLAELSAYDKHGNDVYLCGTY